MLFLKAIRRLAGRAPPAPPPAALPLHPGLVVPAPVHTGRRWRRGVRDRIEGRIVADYDVVAAYPDAITRVYEVVDGTRETPPVDMPMSVIEVANGIVIPGYVTVDPQRGYLFVNHAYSSLPVTSGSPALSRGATFALTPRDPIELPGRVVVIGGPFESNYYHGLLNWFSRFALLDRLAPALAEDPSLRYLIDQHAREEPFISILAALGIAADRIVWSGDERDYRIEKAIFVSFVQENLMCAELFREMARTIRRAVGVDHDRPGWRRLWLGREHHPDARRRIHNIDAIDPILDAHGFERVVLERLSFAEQVTLMSEAAIVLGSHGAGFANIIFCPANCQVLPIEKDFTLFLGIAHLFVTLAGVFKLGTEVIPAVSVRAPGTDYTTFLAAHFADAVVAPDLVESAIVRAIGRADGTT